MKEVCCKKKNNVKFNKYTDNHFHAYCYVYLPTFEFTIHGTI
uniref:Uncharacterized protein n=1 Tax=Anguilla anguilla TaxID=7936 RepID=A0A0E9XZQ6_ANGAN